MITLKGKLKKENQGESSGSSEVHKRACVRDQLLLKEVQEMDKTLPPTCNVHFDDPNILYDFRLAITPDEGYWLGGVFNFHIQVTEEYNMAVSILSVHESCKSHSSSAF